MVGALDDEIVRYLGLYFGSDDNIIQGRIVLLGMEVGQSYLRVNEARGHCHKIKNIYYYSARLVERVASLASLDLRCDT